MYSERTRYHAKRLDQPHYAVIAAAIRRMARGANSVLDVGCSSGPLLAQMANKVRVGLDASKTAGAIFDAPGAVFKQYDLETDNYAVGFFEIITCLEVPEHVKNWSNLLDVVTANADPAGCVMFWSAAPPGQRGAGHVNLQSPIWWRSRLAVHGWRYDRRATRRFRRLIEGIEAKHYVQNGMVYRR